MREEKTQSSKTRSAKEVLVRMWGKNNTRTLKMGIQAITTTLENDIENS
jgi:hypothetical protein